MLLRDAAHRLFRLFMESPLRQPFEDGRVLSGPECHRGLDWLSSATGARSPIRSPHLGHVTVAVTNSPQRRAQSNRLRQESRPARGHRDPELERARARRSKAGALKRIDLETSDVQLKGPSRLALIFAERARQAGRFQSSSAPRVPLSPRGEQRECEQRRTVVRNYAERLRAGAPPALVC